MIAYGCGSPACGDYIRLKLRPNGPKVLRTPEHLNGVPGLTSVELQRVRESACMLSGTIMILTLVFLSGGHVHLEQPQNAMSWLEPVAQKDFRLAVKMEEVSILHRIGVWQSAHPKMYFDY